MPGKIKIDRKKKLASVNVADFRQRTKFQSSQVPDSLEKESLKSLRLRSTIIMAMRL